MDSKKIEAIATDIDFVKKALIIDLVARGFSQEDIGDLLGVSQKTVSVMFPKGILNKAKSLSKV
jgi:DNA-binding NarL/FixJ family response regulator